ncbi:MAG TPA: Ku protein [Gaiellaceae bacterium]|jgi:DNA end-binding protein Ku
MPPRPLWTGSISFGLVNIPARIYSGVHEHKLQFHLVHAKDDGPIGYQKICKLEDRPVENDEIVKAFEVRKGKLVQLTDEDFAAAQVDGQRTIDLEDFVPYDDIDPTFFAHTYVVGPQHGAEKPYALLVRAMEDSGLAGIGKFVMRNRQYLGCLRVRNGVLTLEQMYFADEVDAPEKIVTGKLPSVSKQEREMASSLVEKFSGTWNPKKYKDTYRDALMAVIEQKRKGGKVREAPEPEEEEPPDLMEALRLSIEGRGRSRARRNGSRNGSRKKLDALSKSELQERAKKLDIPGRSKMSKEELAEAVSSAA